MRLRFGRSLDARRLCPIRSYEWRGRNPTNVNNRESINELDFVRRFSFVKLKPFVSVATVLFLLHSLRTDHVVRIVICFAPIRKRAIDREIVSLVC